jgi:hypothetical protein
VVLAGVSNSAASLALTFVVGLAAVWALTQYGGVSNPLSGVTNALGNTPRAQGGQTAA